MEEANSWILLMLQMGFHEQWMNELMPNASGCDTIPEIVQSHGSRSVSLKMEETQGLFSMCLIGLAGAIFFFFFEVFANGIFVGIEMFVKRRKEKAAVVLEIALLRQKVW
jgi:hypothetical protein